MAVDDLTAKYVPMGEKEVQTKEIATSIYEAMKEKGYNAIDQFVGYILSEDPTYITTYKNARSLIRHIDRDELLRTMVKTYFES
jgi:uncharacterized protein (UPF0297 family)